MQQRDMFTSGIVAEIGVNAYAVWSVIKSYADFATGEAFPGMREIGKELGLGKSTVQRAVDVLQKSHMLRIVEDARYKRKGQTYIARERLAVRLGDRIICFVVIDYVPVRLRKQIGDINKALKNGKDDDEIWAQVEIVPGEGFVWDAQSQTLKASVKASALPVSSTDESNDYHRQLGEAIFSKFAPGLKNRLVKK